MPYCKILHLSQTKNHHAKLEATYRKMARMEWEKSNAYQYWKLNKFTDVPHKVDNKRDPFKKE